MRKRKGNFYFDYVKKVKEDGMVFKLWMYQGKVQAIKRIK